MFPGIVGAWLLGAVQADPGVLRWNVPPECPDQAALSEKIQRRLGRPLATDEAQVDARVVRDADGGYTLRMRLSAGARTETRELRDPTCSALADAAALLVAAAVEPPAPALVPAPAAPSPAASGSPPSTSAPPDVPPPDVPPRPAPEVVTRPDPPPPPVLGLDAPVELADPPAPPRRPAGGSLRLHGGGELGAVPRATGALGLAGGVLWRRWRLELAGLFLAPQTEALTRGAARVGLLAAALQGCRRAGRGAVEVPLCLGIEAGGMRGEGRRVAGERSAVAGWLAVLLGSGLAWHASRRWSVFAGLQLVLAPVRPRFELGDPGQSELLFRPSIVSGRLLVGVELRLADPW